MAGSIWIGSPALAAATGAGKILNLDQDKIANAIGIAGCICPPNIARKCMETSPVRMTKYGPAGWSAQAGVTSALLAGMGYTGDTDLFEGEYGLLAVHCTGASEGSRGHASRLRRRMV